MIANQWCSEIQICILHSLSLNHSRFGISFYFGNWEFIDTLEYYYFDVTKAETKNKIYKKK